MSKRFSAAQLRAIRTFDKELSVSAGAGSGKTTVLVERFLTAVTENGLPPDRILASTFTVLNLFIAVVVNAMQEQVVADMKEDEQEHAAEAKIDHAELVAELRLLREEVAAMRRSLVRPEA